MAVPYAATHTAIHCFTSGNNMLLKNASTSDSGAGVYCCVSCVPSCEVTTGTVGTAEVAEVAGVGEVAGPVGVAVVAAVAEEGGAGTDSPVGSSTISS